MKTQRRCPSVAELQMFLDESIASADREHVNTHIQECHDCQQVLETLTDENADTRTQSNSSLTQTKHSSSLHQLMGQLRQQQPHAQHNSAQTPTTSLPQNLAEQQPPAASRTVPGYRLIEELGRGTSGVVYRAVDERLGRTVAVKVLRSDLGLTETARQRLEREARAAAALNHNNIVTLFQIAGESDQAPFLVMEFVDGESLHGLLARQQLVNPAEAVDLVGQLAQALARAHECGVVHRDIKPSNVLIDAASSQAKLTDFGLALDLDLDAQLTREGTIAGTPAYISPEQILDPHNVDGRSDLYSLGVIMYQLLTGELPFRGVVRMTLMSVLHEEPRGLRELNDEVPRDLETICLKTLAKDPAQRYQTAQELFEELERWKGGRPIQARPASRLLKLRRWCGRNPKLAGLSLITGLLLVVVAVGSTAATVILSAAREEARISAKAASDQRDLALTTLQELVYDLNHELERDSVELDHVQAILLQISLDGLRNVAKSAQDAGLTDLSTATAHNGMGIVLIRLQQFTEAKQHLLAAQRILNRLEQAEPDNPEVLASLVQSEWNLGELKSAQEHFPASIKHFQTALTLSQDLHKRPDHDMQSQLILARSYLKLAMVQLQEPDAEQLLDGFAPMLPLFRQLQQASPDDIDLTLDLLTALETMGDFYAFIADYPAAYDHFQELIDAAHEALEAFPENFDITLRIYESYEALGDVAILDDDIRKGRKLLRKALRFAQQHSETLLFSAEELNRLQNRIDELILN